MAGSIGAGARVYMGDAATPAPNWATLTQAQLDAFEVTGKINGISLSVKEGTVDITKLDADRQDFYRKHIAGLSDADGSTNYGEDDVTGAFIRRLLAIKNGKLHPKGRGKVDFMVYNFGAAAGRLKLNFTASFPSLGLNTAVEEEIGGDISLKVDGKIVDGVQA